MRQLISRQYFFPDVYLADRQTIGHQDVIMIFDTLGFLWPRSLPTYAFSSVATKAVRSVLQPHLPSQFTPLSRNVNDARVRRSVASEFIAVHREHRSPHTDAERTQGGNEQIRETLAVSSCKTEMCRDTEVPGRNRGVAIESPRAGRSENGGFNRAAPRHRTFVVVSRTSRHRQDRAHRAARSPFLDWHARSRNASELATSLPSNKGNGDSSGEEEGAG